MCFIAAGFTFNFREPHDGESELCAGNLALALATCRGPSLASQDLRTEVSSTPRLER